MNMARKPRHRGMHAAVVLLAMAVPVANGTAIAATTPVAAPAAASADNGERAAADQRIATLQASLRITAAQMPEWQVFTQAMRDNAAATDVLFRDRAAGAARMNAADNMRSYAAVARSYADNTQKLSDAFQTLYGTLDAAQKQTADTLFRQQAQTQAQSQARK